MRNITNSELAFISGAANHTHVFIDPVAAVQTFLLLVSVGDKGSFMNGATVTGMTVGTAAGGFLGYASMVSALGFGGACATGLVGAGAGMAIGGLAFNGAARFATGVHGMLMG